jgi:hypothetical protein
VIADGRPHGVAIAAAGDHVVAGGQGSPGEVNAHAGLGPVINQVWASAEVMPDREPPVTAG